MRGEHRRRQEGARQLSGGLVRPPWRSVSRQQVGGRVEWAETFQHRLEHWQLEVVPANARGAHIVHFVQNTKHGES